MLLPAWSGNTALAGLFLFVGSLGCSPASAQEAEERGNAKVDYPISVAVAPDSSIVCVDLNLPGVWRVAPEGGEPVLVYRGTKLLRKPMNRPRCCAVLSDGTILVGDTATREIYRLLADGSGDIQPLTSGKIGIPNSLVVTEDGSQVLVADLETRHVFQVPVAGGEPSLFASVNTRGLFSGPENRIFAVTPTSQPLQELSANGDSRVVVGERLFEFPHNGVWLGDRGFLISDGYAKAIWRVDADGKAEKWVTGDPLKNPVGLAISGDFVFVADPHAKQILRIHLDTKEIVPLLPNP